MKIHMVSCRKNPRKLKNPSFFKEFNKTTFSKLRLLYLNELLELSDFTENIYGECLQHMLDAK